MGTIFNFFVSVDENDIFILHYDYFRQLSKYKYTKFCVYTKKIYIQKIKIYENIKTPEF